MASQDYNRHPLPAPPSQSQHDQQQYSYPSSYNNNNSHQQPSTSQQYQSRQQQSSRQPPSHPPVTQQQPQQRPERRPRSRGFSFRSDRSKPDQASGHARKLSGGALHETHAEKEAKRLNTKADPTLAMQEAEPSAVARDAINWEEKPPLSSIQHKDSTGNPIAEPDRSNPTRSKWERPLDTIRSFEAAFDDGYSSRQSVYRTDSDSQSTWNNRRSSYYGNSNGPRFPHEGYYGGGQSRSSQRPESVNFDPRASAMAGGPRDAYFDGFDSGNGGPYGGNGPRNRISRQQPEPYLTSHPVANRNVYPSPNNHRSYETVASGSGSASYGEHSGYQTDPTSSENSSINRRSPHKRQQEPQNDYGISFGQTPGYRPPVLGEAASQPRTMPDNSHAPPPPPKTGATLLRKSSKAAVATEAPRSEAGDKRKSWFSRRFSKNA